MSHSRAPNRQKSQAATLLSNILKILPRPVKQVIKKGVSAYLSHGLGINPKPTNFVLILAHMRSGSSLLCHLLMNHPDVLGGGERNSTYKGIGDLNQLALDLLVEHRTFFKRPDYMLDQINHTRFFNDTSLLNHPRVRPVFLIRTPAQSLSSMVRTFEPIYGDWSIERAATTYIDRLNDLKSLAQSIERPAFFLTYDQLVNDTQNCLAALQQSLALTTPFETSYKTWPFTGQRGDPSLKIASGVIQPQSPTVLETIPTELLDAAQSAYDDCFSVLNDSAI